MTDDENPDEAAREDPGADAESAAAWPSVPEPAKRRRTRSARTFPASSFLEALPIAEGIHEFAAGQRIKRLTLFDKMGRSADSGPSRQLVTNSGQYGLTKGSYQSEWLELTDEGRLASDKDAAAQGRLAARLELAIAKVDSFNRLYEQFKDNRLPTPAVMRDALLEQGMAEDTVDEAVATFLANARDLGLVQNYAGAERLLSFEFLLDALPNEEREDVARKLDEGSPAPQERPGARRVPGLAPQASPSRIVAQATDLSDVCFLVSPIGADGSEHRRHANLVLGSLIEPALEGLGLRLVRADKISKPGLITAQVIDHIVRSPLIVADLSFGNPNVYYELALRHASRRPAVQVIRFGDHLPFDVGQFRTVTLDMTDIFSLVPQLDSYRAEIARQCRAALEEEGPAESPLSLFYPNFWKQFDQG